MNDSQPQVYHVVFHAPGPNWQAGVGFREQPGVQAHVGYMADLLGRGALVLGGPFLDDSGGMCVLRLGAEEAAQVAASDPAVQSGLLVATVKPWMVPMASVTPA